MCWRYSASSRYPHLQKARWQEVAVEYDPYKYNSFPINATRRVNRATKTLQHHLDKAAESGRIAKMPPVLAFQSVVDLDGRSDMAWPTCCLPGCMGPSTGWCCLTSIGSGCSGQRAAAGGPCLD